jgi:hypothetical protein
VLLGVTWARVTQVAGSKQRDLVLGSCGCRLFTVAMYVGMSCYEG